MAQDQYYFSNEGTNIGNIGEHSRRQTIHDTKNIPLNDFPLPKPIALSKLTLNSGT